MKFIHDHKQELRSSNEVLADLQESGRSEVYEERKVTNSFKETCAGPLNLTPRKASQLTRRIIPTSEKKWKALHAHSPDGGHLAASVSKMVTTMLRHFDQEERQMCNVLNAFFIGIKERSIAPAHISWLKANPANTLTNGDWVLSQFRTA